MLMYLKIVILLNILFPLYSTSSLSFLFFFFFNDTATTEIYTLSLHDALPISGLTPALQQLLEEEAMRGSALRGLAAYDRSEEHTSELQSRFDLVCRLLLEKKKKTIYSVFFVLNKKKKTT